MNKKTSTIIINKVNIMSVVKPVVLTSFVVGIIFSLISFAITIAVKVFMSGAGMGGGEELSTLLGLQTISFITMPFLTALTSLIFAACYCFGYNFLASLFGGFKFEVETHNSID